MKTLYYITWSLTSTEFCNWKRATPAVWGSWLTKVVHESTVCPGGQEGQPCHGLLQPQPASWGKWFSCSTLHWCDLTSINLLVHRFLFYACNWKLPSSHFGVFFSSIEFTFGLSNIFHISPLLKLLSVPNLQLSIVLQNQWGNRWSFVLFRIVLIGDDLHFQLQSVVEKKWSY